MRFRRSCDECHQATEADSGDHCIGQTIQGRPERSYAIVSSMEVIRAADHFQRLASGRVDAVASGL